jgi:hypothetical protein
MSVKFGFELETVGVPYQALVTPLTNAGVPCVLTHKNPGEYWGLTWDDTFGGDNAEVTSPVNPDWRTTRTVLEVLTAAGCYTNKECGLHVHVSDDAAPYLRVRLPKIRVWPQRRSFAWKKGETNYSREAVHQVAENRVEVRLFNARIDYHYLLWAVGLVKRSLVYPLVPDAPDRFENHWDCDLVKPPKKPTPLVLPAPVPAGA